MLKGVMFDFGHTIMDELKERETPLAYREIGLMPGVAQVLSQIRCAMAIWANTRVAKEAEVRSWLNRAQIGHHFRWVITSVDAGARKPVAEFFSYALERCKLEKEEVLFVGNQLNTVIRGASEFGVKSVWLSAPEYRSPDDVTYTEEARPKATFEIRSLLQLPELVQKLLG